SCSHENTMGSTRANIKLPAHRPTTYFYTENVASMMPKPNASRTTTGLRRARNPRITALLREIRHTGSLRKASSALGIAPGNAHRLLRGEERRLRVRLLMGSSGGRGGGGSRLTKAGHALAQAGGTGSVSASWWPCGLVRPVSERSPLLVEIPGAGVKAFVAPLGRSREWTRSLRPGAKLELGIVPEAVTIVPSRDRSSGSARNLWRANVIRVGGMLPYGIRLVHVKVGERSLVVAVTISAVSDLQLEPGSAVKLQLKATALRLRKPVR
ncbi:MAG: TOBE domain-containing protein, partial [Thermoplasmata archaeon]